MSECSLICLSCASRHHFAESGEREDEGGGFAECIACSVLGSS